MSKIVYLLFVHTEDGAFCSGVYDSEKKCEEAVAKIGEEVGYKLKKDEDYEIEETEIGKLMTFPVVEFEDEEDEE